MDAGEKTIRQEDCNEDTLGTGILTLTNKRLAFDRTKSRIIDLSKRFGETVLDVPLGDVTRAWTEGLFMKKVCFSTSASGEERAYKFGVLGTGSWLESIEDALEAARQAQR